jgi:hypothetical protein
MHIHSPNKSKKFKQTLSVRKLVTAIFWDKKGVPMMEFVQHGTTIMSEVYCETLKNCVGSHRKKTWNADIRCSAPPWQCAFSYSCLHSSTAGAFQLEVVWSPYSPDLPPSNYHFFTYLKNWLGSLHFNNNEELMEVSKRGWAHRRQTQAYRNLFPVMTSASIPAVTTLRSILSMYIYLDMLTFFSLFVLLTAHRRLLSE